MLKSEGLSRRALLVGVAIAPLAACSPAPDGTCVINPDFVQFFAAVGMVATPVQVFATVVGLQPLRALAEIAGNIATVVEWADRFTPALNAAAQAAGVKMACKEEVTQPVAAVEQGHTDETEAQTAHFARVCFVNGDATAEIEASNDTDVNFLAHNVFWMFRSVRDQSEITYEEMRSSPTSGSFVAALAADEKRREPVRASLPWDEGYVLYSWCIPTGVEPTSEIIKQKMMTGPVFFSCNPFDARLDEAARAASVKLERQRFDYLVPAEKAESSAAQSAPPPEPEPAPPPAEVPETGFAPQSSTTPGGGGPSDPYGEPGY